MATRSSARNKDKAKPNYSNDGAGDENVSSNRRPGRRGRGANAVSKDESDAKDTNTSTTPPPPVASKRGKRKAPPKKAVLEDKEMVDKKLKLEAKVSVKEEPQATNGSLVVPVDLHCTSLANNNGSICFGPDKKPYDAMLNQTNVGMNNNKYYLLQLIQDKAGNYWTWFRWGRIGYARGSQTALKKHPTITAAVAEFEKKFRDKTKNVWEERDEFVKYSGKYDLVKLDYSTKEEENADEGGAADDIKKEPVESKLDPRLLSLIELISNVKAMESAVIEMNYDVKKSPLGKLSKEQIKHGYEALKAIEECIKANQQNTSKCREACSDFYTRIPHNFGFKVPPLIRTLEEVKVKMDLLDALIDIEAAVKILKTASKDEIHKADSFYQNLKCDMKPLEKDSEIFQMLSAYLQNTHGHTHTEYALEIEDIFELKKEGEDERFIDNGNKQLLWHGSRLTNWGGIFSQGLRIAPPEAPVTGYMFGKGVYFADMVSKSANYCFTSARNPTGILLLAEVSLGNERELLESDYYANKLPAGKHSTKGMGQNAPDPSGKTMLGDVLVPMGKPIKTNVVNPKGYTLQYNEYIVYDVKQIKMKYAFKVNFNYNHKKNRR